MVIPRASENIKQNPQLESDLLWCKPKYSISKKIKQKLHESVLVYLLQSVSWKPKKDRTSN